MSAVLSRADMRTVRNVVRWVNVGVQPKQSDAGVLLHLIKPFDLETTTDIRRVAEAISRGVLVTEEICQQAESQLQKIYERGQAEEDGQRDRFFH